MEAKRYAVAVIVLAAALSCIVVLADETVYDLSCSYTSYSYDPTSGSPYFGGGGSGCVGGWSDNFVYVESDHPSDEGWEQWETGSTTTYQNATGYTWKGRIYFDADIDILRPSGTDAYVSAKTRLCYTGGSQDSGETQWRGNITISDGQQTATQYGLTGMHTFSVVWFLKGFAKASSTQDALADSWPSGVNDFWVIRIS